MADTNKRPWKHITYMGVEGWLIPDGTTTPPQTMCENCGFLIKERENYSKLCKEVNKRFGGIAGVTCGVNGLRKPNTI